MVAMSMDERRDNQEFSRSLSAEFAKSTQTMSDEKADLMILNFRRRFKEELTLTNFAFAKGLLSPGVVSWQFSKRQAVGML